ncbi:Dihydroorotase [Acaryochloris thomasi RCC1774]|uniref:Dihydroorotase n=1 Tax=Acaryochloris thomasi RCC1774 TaxID=1764569 RepID=A0A2W1JRX9_9CYAN|nr:dihydroorotase [Acaryochloris thomasi]PZD72754.1 Dihydroorotase [Acaryochloris thomasi RCC1774]
MTHELLHQVRLLDPSSQQDRISDVLISDGQLKAIEDSITNLPSDTQRRDCSGLILGPGLVDLYCHSGTPGFEARETLQSLGEAAAAGGFTRLTLLPDTQPPLDTPDALTRLQAPPESPVQFRAWGAITQDLAGQHLVELSELQAAGVVGFSDGAPLTHPVLVRRLLEYLSPSQVPIALWPVQPALANQGVIREGIQALRLGLPENPTVSETAALAELLEIVVMVPTPVHIMRVSTARSVALIAAAKAAGLPITASATWMHLLWNSKDLASYDTGLRLDPPVGNPEDQEALIQGLQDGILDAIATDHHSYTFEEKTVSFGQAPPGAIGLELVLPMLWQRLVATGRWSALDLWRVLSQQPAQCLAQSPPTLEINQPAEMVLFDPQQNWTVDVQTLHTLGENTPLLNQSIQGKVLATWCPTLCQIS